MAPQSAIGEGRAAGCACTPFHNGELAVQRRAGADHVAAKVGRNILPFVPAEYGEFLGRQPFVVVASQDSGGRVWSSPLVGGVGFARPLDDQQIRFAAAPTTGDPLEEALARSRTHIGVLAIEFHSRSRIRLNGVAQRTTDGILLTVKEAFGNCPKYIQRRLPSETIASRGMSRHGTARALDPGQATLVRRADTFFIASSHPEGGADASHRGGQPGFVEVSDDGRRLAFPDYSGNRMFQTLGNLAVDPRAGLLFLDWESGTALQLSGYARIIWDGEALALRPGAERLVEFDITAVHEFERAMPARWSLLERSRLNPPVNRLAERSQ
jgi:predicted pyridoxine 5'-phosphate oxidase superfamily flavin-nucleotide-binding protein